MSLQVIQIRACTALGVFKGLLMRASESQMAEWPPGVKVMFLDSMLKAIPPCGLPTSFTYMIFAESQPHAACRCPLRRSRKSSTALGTSL